MPPAVTVYRNVTFHRTNIEQEMSNHEVWQKLTPIFPSTLNIPCSIFDILFKIRATQFQTVTVNLLERPFCKSPIDSPACKLVTLFCSLHGKFVKLQRADTLLSSCLDLCSVMRSPFSSFLAIIFQVIYNTVRSPTTDKARSVHMPEGTRVFPCPARPLPWPAIITPMRADMASWPVSPMKAQPRGQTRTPCQTSPALWAGKDRSDDGTTKTPRIVRG